MLKLSEVESVFPHSTLIVVLTPSGELLASRAGGGSAFAALPAEEAGQLLAPIASLKKSAMQFGGALNQMECPVIHIRGNHTMFSCYDVEKNVSTHLLSGTMQIALLPHSGDVGSGGQRVQLLIACGCWNMLCALVRTCLWLSLSSAISAPAAGLLLVHASVSAGLVQLHRGGWQNVRNHLGVASAAARTRRLS